MQLAQNETLEAPSFAKSARYSGFWTQRPHRACFCRTRPCCSYGARSITKTCTKLNMLLPAPPAQPPDTVVLSQIAPDPGNAEIMLSYGEPQERPAGELTWDLLIRFK